MAEHSAPTSPPSFPAGHASAPSLAAQNKNAEVNEKSANRLSSSSTDLEAATVAEEEGVTQEANAETSASDTPVDHPPSDPNLVTWDGPDDPYVNSSRTTAPRNRFS